MKSPDSVVDITNMSDFYISLIAYIEFSYFKHRV